MQQIIPEMAFDNASNDTDHMFMDAFGLSNLNWSATEWLEHVTFSNESIVR